MTTVDALPMSGAELDAWTAGLTPPDAAAAVVLLGLDVAAWLAAEHVEHSAPLVAWRPDPARLRAGPGVVLGMLPPGTLQTARPPGPAGVRPAHRLVVDEASVPPEVVPRLLGSPAVDAVLVPTRRAPGALRRRPWRWPLRVGVLGDDPGAGHVAAALHRAGGLPPELLHVRDVRTEPAAVDVLLVPGTLDACVRALADTPQTANAVVVLDDPAVAWPVVDAQLALVRAITGAVVTVLGRLPADPVAGGRPGGPDAAAVAAVLHRLLRAVSHALPVDVALTEAFDRRCLVIGEPDALRELDLPHLARAHADVLRRAGARLGGRAAGPTVLPDLLVGADLDLATLPDLPFVSMSGEPGAAPPDPSLVAAAGTVGAAADELDAAAAGTFLGETHEAARVGPALDRAEAALDAATPERLLQCRVRPVPGAPIPVLPNTLTAGTNTVEVFIGPPEVTALAAGAVTNVALGFRPGEVSVRVTVVLVPLEPPGEVRRTEVDVPRVGRSSEARFLLEVPAGTGDVRARVVVVHRNRVLQTALLTGSVGGTARLEELAVVWRDLTRTDDRRAFDLALVANHDDAGRSALVAHAGGRTSVDVLPEVAGSADRMRALLTAAEAKAGRGGKPSAAALRRLLVELAVEGRDLHGFLEGHLLPLGRARRVQLVTARSGWFLPLELVYDRPAPDPDAVVCPAWLRDGGTRCGPACGTGPDDVGIVCPMAFWGLSRTIERHWMDPTEGGAGPQYLTVSDPDARRRRLGVAHAAVAASAKVKEDAVARTLTFLDPGARHLTSWEAWAEALRAARTDVLVLMPHTLPDPPSLEISRVALHRGRIEARYVTGGLDVQPIVVLLGCDTAGTADDPAGFASRFMARKAAAVLTTLTMLHSAHAPLLAQRLAALLRDPGRAEQPLGDLVTEFRRSALHEGHPAALAVAAYGDADWTV